MRISMTKIRYQTHRIYDLGYGRHRLCPTPHPLIPAYGIVEVTPSIIPATTQSYLSAFPSSDAVRTVAPKVAPSPLHACPTSRYRICIRVRDACVYRCHTSGIAFRSVVAEAGRVSRNVSSSPLP